MHQTNQKKQNQFWRRPWGGLCFQHKAPPGSPPELFFLFLWCPHAVSALPDWKDWFVWCPHAVCGPRARNCVRGVCLGDFSHHHTRPRTLTHFHTQPHRRGGGLCVQPKQPKASQNQPEKVLGKPKNRKNRNVNNHAALLSVLRRPGMPRPWRGILRATETTESLPESTGKRSGKTEKTETTETSTTMPPCFRLCGDRACPATAGWTALGPWLHCSMQPKVRNHGC